MRILGNLLLISVSLVLSVLAAELLARIVLDPIDYLLPQLVKDDFLIHRIAGFSGGHDAWGFRNTGTPESADIVCIGDSVTYGIAAKASESWPTVLGRIRKTSVYNMSLGGYGPIQYLHLMRTRAVKLHPKIVIVGFYLGNDFWDVYYEVRYNKNWNAYGKLDDSNVKAPKLAYQPPPEKFLGGLRDWLATHSVFYALLTRTSIWDFVRERETMAGNDASVVEYRDDKHKEIFNFGPGSLRFLDMDDPRMKPAMEITKQVMLDMRSLAEKEGFRLVVAMIPTKERVYGRLLGRRGYIEKYPRLADAIHQEDVARDAIVGFLHRADIEVVDLLPKLEGEVDETDPYPFSDPHPNKDGYRVIAETINNYINNHR